MKMVNIAYNLFCLYISHRRIKKKVHIAQPQKACNNTIFNARNLYWPYCEGERRYAGTKAKVFLKPCGVVKGFIALLYI